MTTIKYLVTADEIREMEGLHKSHFLNSNAVRSNKSLGDLAGITGFGIHIIEVQSGHETTELHVHHHEDECVYVLSGSATATIGDEKFAINAGDFIGYRKGGLAHSIVNTGTEPLRCIVVGERLPHDVVDYPNVNKRLFRNAGLKPNLADHQDIVEPVMGAKK